MHPAHRNKRPRDLTAIESILMHSTSMPGAHDLICSKSPCQTTFIARRRSFESTLCRLPYFSGRAIQGRPSAKPKKHRRESFCSPSMEASISQNRLQDSHQNNEQCFVEGKCGGCLSVADLSFGLVCLTVFIRCCVLFQGSERTV